MRMTGKRKRILMISLYLSSAVMLLNVQADTQVNLIGIASGSGTDAAQPSNDQPETNPVQSSSPDLPQDSQQTAQEIAEEEAWSLILVNKSHPIPSDYVIPELTQLAGGHSIDSRVYPHLQQMFDDARAQGIYPQITSSYRTMEKQQALMDDKILEYVNSGYTQEQAKELAEEWVAVPGTSEHQLGLSLDISGDESRGSEAGSVWYWLKEYCTDYGFVIRYPEDKTQITGIIHEPWHFRYVGRHAAKIMKEENLCLEEYLQAYPN